MKRLLPPMLAALALACDSPSAPREGLPVEFTFGVARSETEPAFFAVAADGAVTVRGSFLVPCNPYEATARSELDGETLIFRIVGENRDDCPQDVVLSIGYRAVVRDLAPGPYLVRVIHEWRDVSWEPTTVLESEVRVDL